MQFIVCSSSSLCSIKIEKVETNTVHRNAKISSKASKPQVSDLWQVWQVPLTSYGAGWLNTHNCILTTKVEGILVFKIPSTKVNCQWTKGQLALDLLSTGSCYLAVDKGHFWLGQKTAGLLLDFKSGGSGHGYDAMMDVQSTNSTAAATRPWLHHQALLSTREMCFITRATGLAVQNVYAFCGLLLRFWHFVGANYRHQKI